MLLLREKETKSYKHTICIISKDRTQVSTAILFLNSLRLSGGFISSSTSSHIFGPKKVILSVPLKTAYKQEGNETYLASKLKNPLNIFGI